MAGLPTERQSAPTDLQRDAISERKFDDQSDAKIPSFIKPERPGAPPVDEAGRSAGRTKTEVEISDHADKRPTTRKELWAFYFFYIGNQGLPGFNYGPSQFQNLLFLSGTNKVTGAACHDYDLCVLPFAGTKQRSINSIVLACNGISFSIQIVLFLAIGSLADYGRWRPYILMVFTAGGVAVAFAWLGVQSAQKWHSAVALYMLGLICYQGALTFWTAAFPALARGLKDVQDSHIQVLEGTKTQDEHWVVDSMARNRVSNVSFAVASVGTLIVLCVMVGILFGIDADASTENNTKAFSVIIAYAGGIWAVCAIPWFCLEKHRPGLSLPPGSNYLTVGLKTLVHATQECWKLRDTFLYLVFYFIMGDVLNTAVTVISTLQNSIVSYSTTQLTYLLIVGYATQWIGICGFWAIQKRWKLSTLSMFWAVVLFVILLTGWGVIGIWSTRFGFKNVWEVWMYQVFYSIFVCPWYVYSQTMISEVIPQGREFFFFSLFSIVGKTSSFIGPLVSSAIIDNSGNTSMPFAFLFALGIASTPILYFVDVPRSRRQCAQYLESEAVKLGYRRA